MRVVIAPRVCAITLTAVLLYPPCAALMLVTAFVFALGLGDQSVAVSWWSVVSYIQRGVLWEGLARMALFGAVIAMATTHAGLSVWLTDRRAARDIGAAVYDGAVLCVIAIVVANLALSLAGGTG
jgi:ABC-type transporter Mla maintaining outer membrane lipid asymmetry permease subunit MlaE